MTVLKRPPHKRIASIVSAFTLGLLCLGWLPMLTGCNDPDAVGRFKATPVTNIILDSLGVVDEKPEIFQGSRDPASKDLVAGTEEYIVGPGDVVDISVWELFNTNVEWVGRKEVSESGRVTVPVIGTFSASGRTELELTEDIINLLSPDFIRDPKVSVVVVGSRERIYSISGSVSTPGQYPLAGNDFRISAAMAQAGGIPQVNADYAYVIRRVTDDYLDISETDFPIDDHQDALPAPSLPPAPGATPDQSLPVPSQGSALNLEQQ